MAMQVDLRQLLGHTGSRGVEPGLAGVRAMHANNYPVEQSHGHLDLADLRSSLNQPGLGSHPSGDVHLHDVLMQHVHSPHLMDQSGARSPENNSRSSGQLSSHPSGYQQTDYLRRGKTTDNLYYTGPSSQGEGSPGCLSQHHLAQHQLAQHQPQHQPQHQLAQHQLSQHQSQHQPLHQLAQHQLVQGGKRKWIAQGGMHEDGSWESGPNQNAVSELARENLLLKHQLQFASHEMERLKYVLMEYEMARDSVGPPTNGAAGQSRYWTEEEHLRFLDAIENYGHKDVKAIASFVGTRNATQVRTHAQKYFIKLARSGKEGESTSGMNLNPDALSNPDREEDMDDHGGMMGENRSLKEGKFASTAASFISTHGKHSSSSKKKSSRQERAPERKGRERKSKGGSSSHSSNQQHVGGNLAHGMLDVRVGSNLVSNDVERVRKVERSKVGESSSRIRKRERNSAKVQQAPGGPGSPSSCGSNGISDSTSTGNGSNGPSEVQSSDATNGNGSSNGSNCNGSSSAGGGGVDSNNASNEGSDNQGSDAGIGFFGRGEERENFSDEL